jgi:hypothetical protein
VPGSEILTPAFICKTPQKTELELTITHRTRIGRQPFEIRMAEGSDHPLLKLFTAIDHFEFNPQFIRSTARGMFHRVTAGTGEESQGYPHDAVALLNKQSRRYT